jgi:glycopeptide antibiotics resistance protein
MPTMNAESALVGEATAEPFGRVTSRQWAGWLLLAYLLVVCALVLSVRLTAPGLPGFTDSLVAWSAETGILAGLPFDQAGALANVAVFVPIGFLLAGLWGRRGSRRAGTGAPPRSGMPDWMVFLVATAWSAGLELTQLYLLAEASGTVRDLVCNSAGALAGVVLHRVVQVARRRGRAGIPS